MAGFGPADESSNLSRATTDTHFPLAACLASPFVGTWGLSSCLLGKKRHFKTIAAKMAITKTAMAMAETMGVVMDGGT